MSSNKFILTIAIPTVVTRKAAYDLLRNHIQSQINEFGLQKKVELIAECDNKEMSIGAKRQKLIDKAKGKFIVQIDDDDMVPYHFVYNIIKTLDAQPDVDCVGYLEKCVYAHKVRHETSCFSRKFKDWADNIDGYDHVRTPFFKTPIRTDLCRIVGVSDMRFGEDHDFARRIYPLLKTEAFINEYMYEYRYKEEPHNIKYGIKG